ncbi:MAG TPA: AraC family transcriptional regulator [Candidatus Mediterraneibacter ornithocaccae]|uniref:AraC family transcriptional regulator n=1 Tax=Mediterraneibacter glycyrrhizinilyticus TaxID=342942 RepID=UPI001F8DD1B7|nr:AraC family transcriptional regulator [Mediterraneibacter glycyrrhizinilyticus]MDN0043508.1 AraC family transcriptional regulator [Mediterraneibacter glycyrrhizinilyticus]MDN0059855.1 AraC family transcriptional regulator [Mediterraneibacter glycyrrhizinilyticus]HJA18407.1 AraC family transcriptional regulator [Candidatus Mediterraneibacter ornithocaccae]
MHEELLRELSVITEEEQRILDGRREIDQQIYTEKKDMVIDSKKLLQKGKLIQVRPHTRFVHFPKHTHNYIEMIYMCQGSTTHILNGNEIVLEQGDLLFLNQNAVQEILPAGEDDIAVNFIVLPEFLDTAFSMMGDEENQLRDFLVGALCGRDGETSWMYFHVADILPIQNLIENMVWTIFYDSSNKRSCTQITMGLLFLQLLNYMDKMETGGTKYDSEITAAVLSYINGHYKNGTLSELSEQMGYDVYWLSREIRRRTGRTYKELLQEKRMQQAVYLLANSEIPVTDIIESIGYDNTSYFYRKFREKYGMSPKEYRKNYV